MKKTRNKRKRKNRGGTKSVAAKKVFSDPFLSRYISEFNLVPGKKYKINNSNHGLTFISEINDINGLNYVFEQIGSNGEPYQITYSNLQRFPINIKEV